MYVFCFIARTFFFACYSKCFFFVYWQCISLSTYSVVSPSSSCVADTALRRRGHLINMHRRERKRAFYVCMLLAPLRESTSQYLNTFNCYTSVQMSTSHLIFFKTFHRALNHKWKYITHFLSRYFLLSFSPLIPVFIINIFHWFNSHLSLFFFPLSRIMCTISLSLPLRDR